MTDTQLNNHTQHNRENLSPMFKWTGGKRREINTLKQFFPDFVKQEKEYTFVEPFVGGGAIYWYLNNITGKNIINDFEKDITNFYNQVRTQSPTFLTHIEEACQKFDKTCLQNINKTSDEMHDQQEKMYYYWRNLDRDNGLNNLSSEEIAARFWIVNQLSFSGMRRFNGKGEFNVPFGHYKNLNSKLISNRAHIDLLNNTIIMNGDYSKAIEDQDNDNTFIFLDPPYTRVMKNYSGGTEGEFGDEAQKTLAERLKKMDKASWLLVIDKSELTESLYKDHIVHTYDLNYGVNIKNRIDQSVQHIIATNY